MNLGNDLPVRSLADPLLAPPVDSQWLVIWSSEDLAYGGGGRRAIDFQKRWTLGADTALLLAPAEEISTCG